MKLMDMHTDRELKGGDGFSTLKLTDMFCKMIFMISREME